MKQVEGFMDLPCLERLRQLKPYFVQGCLLRADLIRFWWIFHGEGSNNADDISDCLLSLVPEVTVLNCRSIWPSWRSAIEVFFQPSGNVVQQHCGQIFTYRLECRKSYVLGCRM